MSRTFIPATKAAFAAYIQHKRGALKVSRFAELIGVERTHAYALLKGDSRSRAEVRAKLGLKDALEIVNDEPFVKEQM